MTSPAVDQPDQPTTQDGVPAPQLPDDLQAYHLARMLADSAGRFAELPATRVLVADGSWRVQTYREFHDGIRRLAAGLVAQGVRPGDRVALFSGNRPEWSTVDFAVLAVGAVVVPVFANSRVEQVRHVLTDSEPCLAFVAGQRELGIVREAAPGLPVASMDHVDGVTSLPELQQLCSDELLAEVDRRTAAGRGDDVATIIYTSGTTGLPRGVMLTHAGFGNQQQAIDDCWDFGPGDQSVCFLPLAHSLERDWTFHLFHSGCLNTYCTNPRTIGELLPRARPNLLVSVPMLFEKVMAGTLEQAGHGPRRRVVEWALSVGRHCQQAAMAGEVPSAFWRAQLPWADRLVLSRIRAAVGGNKKLLVSGGAPLRRQVEDFFSAAGILLGQGYGLTESGPMMTIYRPDRYRLGTVGFPIKGSRITTGDGGELLVSGPSVMKGYWHDPEATAKVLHDGWLHTGDVGAVDQDGFVRVTDRLKEIIVTRNGKNVAPQPIEALLLGEPRFEQVVVVGDDRPCLVAVVQPSSAGLESFAQEAGLSGDEPTAERRHRLEQVVLARVGELLAGLPGHEQVRGVVLAHDEITLASGLLTPTMKIRRRQVADTFASRLDELYRRIAAARR